MPTDPERTNQPDRPLRREIPRRTFILGVVASAVGFSLVGWWRFRTRQSEEVKGGGIETTADVLRRRLDFLDLEPTGVERFARDVEALVSRIEISPAGKLIEPELPVLDGLVFTIDRGAIRFFEDTVVRKYLLSSTFFIDGTDESKTVRYLGWFDEYAPCVNPFAQLD